MMWRSAQISLTPLISIISIISIISTFGCKAKPIVKPTVDSRDDPSGPSRRAISLPVVAEELSDPTLFTQCLMFDREGGLWATSGGVHSSLLVKLSRGDGREDERDTASEPTSIESASIEGLFVEGCVEYDRWIMILTWRDRVALLFDRETLTLSETLSLPNEGWGLTRAMPRSTPQGVESLSEVYVYSDGSSALHWFDPQRSVAERAISTELVTYVRDQDDRPVYQLNELEWFGDHLLANHYPSDRVAVIEPVSSRVVLWLDLSTLRAREPRESLESYELNGIAYETASDLVWFTGKGWTRRYALDARALRTLLE